MFMFLRKVENFTGKIKVHRKDSFFVTDFALTLRFLRKFRKLTAKNITTCELGNLTALT